MLCCWFGYFVSLFGYLFPYSSSIVSLSLDLLFFIHDSLLVLLFFISYHLCTFILRNMFLLFDAFIDYVTSITIVFLYFIDCILNNKIHDSKITYYSSTFSRSINNPSRIYTLLTYFPSLNNFLFYFFSCNTSILIPILSTIRFFVFSYDVIHSLGIYSFGIKIDAIPGRFNFASTIRTLIKGAHYGFCYELCGHGHSSMLIVGKTLRKQTKQNRMERNKDKCSGAERSGK